MSESNLGPTLLLQGTVGDKLFVCRWEKSAQGFVYTRPWFTHMPVQHVGDNHTDLFTELEELKEIESKLVAELAEFRKNQIEVDELVKKVALLEERTSLSEQLAALSRSSGLERQEEAVKGGNKYCLIQNLVLEVIEWRRLNKELHMQKRNLTCWLSSMESQLSCSANSSDFRDNFLQFD